ncbi:MAG: carboxypeptidase regulatory-like domain-containing protein [Candidatus Sericytochromatia bacterium]
MKNIKTTILALLISIYPLNSFANQSTNSNPWGFTGLINMPTANIQKTGEFDVTANYLMRTPSFTTNAHMGVFENLEVGLVGGIPSSVFSGLAGNIKYQFIKPTEKNPTALSAGINMLGLAKNTYLTNGNYLYMVVSHDFNLKLKDNSIYNLFSGHFGFGGNHFGSRLMAGIDMPVTDYVNLNLEYLGRTEELDEMFNFGIKSKPIPKLQGLTISLLSSGTSLKGFANTEFFLSVGYGANLFPNNSNTDIKKNTENKVDSDLEDFSKIKKIPVPPPTPIATPKPEKSSFNVEAEKKEIEIIEKKEIIKPTPKPIPTIIPTPTPIPTAIPTVIPTPKNTPEPIKETIKEVVPKEEPKIEEVELKKEVKTGLLKGYVKNSANSQKMPNVDITIKALNSNFEKKVSTDELGIFTCNDLNNGDYSIIFKKDGFSEVKRNFIIKSEETTEVIVDMFSEKGALVVKITDEDGKPLKELTATLDKNKKFTLDKDGKYAFNSLNSGLHTINVFRKNKEIKSVEVEVISGIELSKEIVIDSGKRKIEVKKLEEPKKVSEVKKVEPKKEANSKPKENEKNSKKIETKSKPKLTKSSFFGKTTDKTGVLKGVKIMLEGDKLTSIATSNDKGEYSLKNIPSGDYKMTFSKDNYVSRTFVVKLKQARKAKYDIKLTSKEKTN